MIRAAARTRWRTPLQSHQRVARMATETTTTPTTIRAALRRQPFASRLDPRLLRKQILDRVDYRQAFYQWIVGMMVATPLIALLQGTLLLQDYRDKHDKAPFPYMPARGVAVAVEGKERNRLSQRAIIDAERPLRILVIGDSLAAGVGMSKSGTPVLPESIARSLSGACGGRPVYWTCVGTPGVSASKLVQEITDMEQSIPQQDSSTTETLSLEQKLKAWQAKLRKWQERKDLKRRLTELENAQTETGDDVRKVDEKVPNAFVEWWNRVRSKDKSKVKASEVSETTRKVLKDWWNSIQNRFRQRWSEIQEEIIEIKEIVESDIPPEEESSQGNEQTTVGENSSPEGKRDVMLSRTSSSRQRPSLKSKVVAEQYDIAIVLTGLNDVKEAFLPHMNSGDNNGLKGEQGQTLGGLANHLNRVLGALRDKMEGQMDLEEGPESSAAATMSAIHPNEKIRVSSDVDRSSTQKTKHPMVVLPELPIAPVQFFKVVPLRWYLIPLFRAMEKNKEFLSQRFPDFVVFVPQPDLQVWSDVENDVGPIRAALKRERLLLATTDIAQNVKERIQKLMKEHYNSFGDQDEPSGENAQKASKRNLNTQQGRDDYSHLQDPGHQSDQHVLGTTTTTASVSSSSSSSSLSSNSGLEQSNNDQRGASLICGDGIHPNDEGYEVWGRHIAAAIVEQWNKQQNQ